jgi:hypothetical protein
MYTLTIAGLDAFSANAAFQPKLGYILSTVFPVVFEFILIPEKWTCAKTSLALSTGRLDFSSMNQGKVYYD